MKLDELSMRRLEEYLSGRKRIYELTFGNRHGKMVLADLARFCRAHESCFHPDPRLHAVAEGRREVWLRIQQHLRLDEDQLAELWAFKKEESK